MNILEIGASLVIQDKLNLNLVDEVKKFLNGHLEYFYKDKDGYSTTGENAEQYWILRHGLETPFSYKNEEYFNIEKKIRGEVYGRLKASSLLRDEDVGIQSASMWTVIGEEGSYHTVHSHHESGNGVVVVLYLEMPKEVEKDGELDNSIFLFLHTNQTSPFIKNSIPKVLHIKPEVGTILIFSGNILHGTYPQTKGLRQTFNIDYRFERTKSNFAYG